MNRKRMETMQEAIERLERLGFYQQLLATVRGELRVAGASGSAVDPESLIVEETIRFEGSSDPDDEAVLFALRSRDRSVMGTFVATYGPTVDAATAATVERLHKRLRAGASRSLHLSAGSDEDVASGS